MLTRISSKELSEWIAFSKVEPIGEERADLRAASIASTIANVNRDPKKQKEPFSPADFMIDFEKAWETHPQDEPKKKIREKKSSDDLLAIVEALNVAYNGTDNRPDKIQ